MFPNAFFRRHRRRDGNDVNESPLTREQTTFALVLLLLGIFLVSSYYAWHELRYLRAGTPTEATVLNITERRGEHTAVGYTVWYRFDMLRQGKPRTIQGSDDITLSAQGQYRNGQTIQVEYIDGEFISSRILGNGYPFWVAMFFISLALILAGSVYLYLYTRHKTSD